MKQKLAIPLATLLFTSSPAQEDKKIDPFLPPDSAKEVPGKAIRDPSGPAEQTAGEDTHLWKDHFVKPGGEDGPDYVKIVGSFDRGRNQVTVLLRIAVQQYQKAIEHPDHNRGVGLISGRPGTPDITCWLRPFHFTDKTAEFYVLVSRKSAAQMYLFFIPQAGSDRYLYELGRVAQDIVERKP